MGFTGVSQKGSKWVQSGPLTQWAQQQLGSPNNDNPATWLGSLASIAALGAQYDAKQFDQLVGIAQMVLSLTARGFIFTSQGIYWGGDEANPAQMVGAGQITGVDDATVELLHMLFDPYQAPSAPDALGQPTDASETEGTHVGEFINHYVRWFQDRSLTTLQVVEPPQMSTDPELAGIAEQIDQISGGQPIAGTDWWLPTPAWLQQLVAPPPILKATTDSADSDENTIAQYDATKGVERPDSESTGTPVTNPTPPNPNNTGSPLVTTGGPPTVPIPQVIGITNVQPAQQRFIGGVAGVPTGGYVSAGGGGDPIYGFGDGDGAYFGGGKHKTKGGGGGGGGGGGHGGGDDPGQRDDGHGQSADPGGGGGGGHGAGGDAPSGNGKDDGTGSGGAAAPAPGAAPGSGKGGVLYYFDQDTGTYVVVTKQGDPGPDDSGGGDSKPSIPYGPHHNSGGTSTAPQPPPMPYESTSIGPTFQERLLRMRLALLGVSGYASGDDLGAAGYNPHFNPDPDGGTPTGPTPGGEGGPKGPTPGGGSGPSAEDGGVAAPPSGPDPDNEWGAGGYNPHYQPSGGYSWTPYSRGVGSGVTRQTPVARKALGIRLR